MLTYIFTKVLQDVSANPLYKRLTVSNPSNKKSRRSKATLAKESPLKDNELFQAIQGKRHKSSTSHVSKSTKPASGRVVKSISSSVFKDPVSKGRLHTSKSKPFNPNTTKPSPASSSSSERAFHDKNRKNRNEDITSSSTGTVYNHYRNSSSKSTNQPRRPQDRNLPSSSRTPQPKPKEVIKTPTIASPEKPKPVNSFSIRYASLPPILLMRNLAPGTSTADVQVSIRLLFISVLYTN